MLKTKDGLDLVTQNWTVANPKACLVLTHGYNDHANRFQHVAQALNAAGYSLYAYDVRGHGKSGGQRGHTPNFDSFLDDLSLVFAQARQDAPNQKFFAYGHSMGGNITLNYAIRRPAGLSGVIATGPWLKLAFEPPALQMSIAKIMARLNPTFSQKNVMDLPGLSRDEKVQIAYRDDPLLHQMITAKLATEIFQNGLTALEQAGQLKLPLLLMHGATDPITSNKATEAFYQAAGSADKTFKLYPEMRHEIHNEFGQEQVFADMMSWLDKHI
jgi:alpha-beta hydrolase superfamily lysophospholipase